VTQDTENEYVSAVAPKVAGYIFTGWTSTDVQGFVARDAFGRSYDGAHYRPFQGLVLTANYLPEDEDSDGDGVADGHEMYWYGNLDEPADSDTDGDGYTFAQELAAGTSPLMPDRSITGGVVWKDSDAAEVNLQPYEQMIGALVDDKYTELFTSPIAGNGAMSRTFAGGTQIWPVVADVNGDGLWDMIVVSETTTNGTTMLVSDADGRIWMYEREAARPESAPYRRVE